MQNNTKHSNTENVCKYLNPVNFMFHLFIAFLHICSLVQKKCNEKIRANTRLKSANVKNSLYGEAFHYCKKQMVNTTMTIIFYCFGKIFNFVGSYGKTIFSVLFFFLFCLNEKLTCSK